MKRILILSLACLLANLVWSQIDTIDVPKEKVDSVAHVIGISQNISNKQTVNLHRIAQDSILTRIENLIETNNNWLEHIELNMSLKERYKLYPTENIYTFLQLDTKTGRIEQVQWSLKSDNEGSIIINNDDLTYGYGYGSRSFELYPTKNMYQFILLDKTDGRRWHIQWGTKYNERWIRRIY